MTEWGWREAFNTAEWISHIDSLLRHIRFSGGSDSQDEEQAREGGFKGRPGRWSYRDERELLDAMINSLKAQHRKLLEGFFRTYFSGSDEFSSFRAKERFEQLRTVLADMRSEAYQYGNRTTTTRQHSWGTDRRRRGGRRGPADYTETVTEEELWSPSRNKAVDVLNHLAKEINRGRLKARAEMKAQGVQFPNQQAEERCLHMGYIAGHEVLKSYDLPRMPEPQETDWIDFVEKVWDRRYQGVERLREFNRRMAEWQQPLPFRKPIGMSRSEWKELKSNRISFFDRLLMKLPF